MQADTAWLADVEAWADAAPPDPATFRAAHLPAVQARILAVRHVLDSRHPRHAAARQAFERAMGALDSGDADGLAWWVGEVERVAGGEA